MLEVIEPFLGQAAVTVADLMAEFRNSGTEWRLFTQGSDGEPISIGKLSERQHGNNVFFVPASRLDLFLAATRSVGATV